PTRKRGCMCLPRLRVGLVRSLSLGKLGEPLTAQWLPQFQEATRLNLADAFPRDAVGAGHLFQGPGLAVPQTKTQFDHLTLPRRQRPQYFGDAFAEQMLIDGLA